MEPDWSLYRSALAVMEEGSLSGAARRLGLTQPTLARHVEALEARLGRALFLRSPRGLLPTDAALALRPHAEAMAAAAASALRATGGPGAVEGTVRVTASEVVGIEVLPPILAALRRAHPALAVELVATNDTDDLAAQAADLAVRMTEPKGAALVARRVGAIRLGFFAHRDYLARRGAPATLADLAGHDLIGFDRETPFVRAFAAALPGLGREGFGLRADSHLAQLAAIRAGYGIGVAQAALAARDPALAPVLPDAFAPTLPVHVVMHEASRALPRVRAAFDALVDGLARHVRAAPPP